MATVNYYISRKVKSEDERVEIQLRFCGNRSFVKRGLTGIFIMRPNWDNEKEMPKTRTTMYKVDDCEVIRFRLFLLQDYLINCWTDAIDNGTLKDDSLTQWLDDIVWIEPNNKRDSRGWELTSKKQIEAEKKRKKLEAKQAENRLFLDVFKEYVDEQLENGVIVPVRHKTYYTCIGIWDRMEKYHDRKYKLKEVTTETLYEFRHFILNEHKLWTTKTERGAKMKNQKQTVKLVPKKEFAELYKGYEFTLIRGVEKRSINYVVVQFKYVKAFWHWLLRVKKLHLEDIFAGFNMDQSVYGTPYFFSNEDRNILFNADFSARPDLAVQRDIFVFQSLVGCRVGDLTRLKKSNIVDGQFLQYVAGKTKNSSGRIVTVPLHPIAKIIVERYADIDGERLLPFDCDQRYNTMIKEMFKAVPEIDHVVTVLDPVTRLETQKRLSEVASSHMGRRNFCGNLYDAGFRDSDITAMSGHAEGSHAIARYRKVSDEMKQKMIDSL